MLNKNIKVKRTMARFNLFCLVMVCAATQIWYALTNDKRRNTIPKM
jgi:hypothetical protein